VVNGSLSAFLKRGLFNESDYFRESMQQLSNYTNGPSVTYTKDVQNNKASLIYSRQDGLLYKIQKIPKLAFYEIVTKAFDISLQEEDNMVIERDFFYVAQEFSKNQDRNYILQTPFELDDDQRDAFYILQNTVNQPLAFYPQTVAKLFMSESLDGISSNKTLFGVIIYVAIAITFVTALFIIPIILRIESNKERVFKIYAELNKNDIDDRKRNIRIFFAKLRQSTNNPGGSLFYQKSSRIVSSRLLTKSFH